jgi:hypothetical protein
MVRYTIVPAPDAALSTDDQSDSYNPSQLEDATQRRQGWELLLTAIGNGDLLAVDAYLSLLSIPRDDRSAGGRVIATALRRHSEKTLAVMRRLLGSRIASHATVMCPNLAIAVDARVIGELLRQEAETWLIEWVARSQGWWCTAIPLYSADVLALVDQAPTEYDWLFARINWHASKVAAELAMEIVDRLTLTRKGWPLWAYAVQCCLTYHWTPSLDFCQALCSANVERGKMMLVQLLPVLGPHATALEDDAVDDRDWRLVQSIRYHWHNRPLPSAAVTLRDYMIPVVTM